MDDASLVLSLRECGSDSFFDPGKTICTYNHYVSDSSVLEFVKNTQPVFGALILSYAETYDVFVTFAVYGEHHISCKLANKTIVSH